MRALLAKRFELFSLFALCVVASLPSEVGAQMPTRVVVETFRGPRARSVRTGVVEDLERNGVVVLAESEVRDARRRFQLRGRLSEEDYRLLAEALDVTAIITGRVTRRRRRWSARVRVRNGATGEELGRTAWGGRTASSLNAVRRTAHSRLSPFLANAMAPAEANGASSAPDTPDGETPWYMRREVEEEVASSDDESSASPEEAAEDGGGDGAGYEAFRILIGGGTLFRSMSSTVRVYAARRGIAATDPANEFLDEPRSYLSAGIGHFELGGQLELYPGAFERSPVPYLGAIVSFSHSLGLVSNGADRVTGETVTVPTSQLDFLALARFRYRFGERRDDPQMMIDAGWGMFQFNLGTTELQRLQPNTVVPPMEHGYVHLGAGIRFPIVPGYLSALLEGAGRIGTSIGAQTRNVWGVSSEPSNGFVTALELRVSIPEIDPGVFVAVRGQYFQLITAFAGQVTCALADGCFDGFEPWEDDQPWELWPEEPGSDNVIGGPADPVTDHYFRLQLQVGYAYY